MNTTYLYRLYGLTVASCLELPALYSADGAPDVFIEYGTVPEFIPDLHQHGVLFQVKPGAFLFTREDTARYLVTGGNRITIDRFSQADDLDIRQFLLGAGLGALLHQRRSFPLHGSVVAHAGEGFVFLGASGHGKSSLAAVLHRRGYSVFGDDVCVVDFDAGHPRLHPGPAQIQIWPNTVEALGEREENLLRLRRRVNKRAMVYADKPEPEPVRLKRLYLLAPDDGPEIHAKPMTGPEVIQTLVNNTFRVEYLQGMGVMPEHLAHCARLTSAAGMRRLIRPKLGFQLEALADFVERDMNEA